MTSHAIQRAKERFGLDLTERDIANIRWQCLHNKLPLVSMSGDSKTYLLRIKGVALCPVMAGVALVTFLDPTSQQKRKLRQKVSRQGIQRLDGKGRPERRPQKNLRKLLVELTDDD